MHLRFAQGHADAQDGAFAVQTDAQGEEHRTVQEASALADFLVTGVNEHVGETAQRAMAPALQFGVQLGGALADLRGADGVAAELFHDGGDFAGGDTLNIHFGQCQLEGLFAADAFIQGGGIEVQITAHLWNLELDRADASGEGLGFVAIGVALAGVSAFVGLGLERVRAFLAHGFIDEEADAFGEAAGAFFIEQLQNGIQEFRIAWVGHFGFELDVFRDTPTGNQCGPPSTSFSRAERLHPSGVRLRSARYARLRSASPRRGGGGGKKDKLQKEFYTPKRSILPIGLCIGALTALGAELTITSFDRSGNLAWTNSYPVVKARYALEIAQNPAGPWDVYEFVTNQTSLIIDDYLLEYPHVFFRLWTDPPPATK